MDTIRVGRRVLARAAARMGGVDALGARLEIDHRVLHHYITGIEPVPESMFMLAIDVILEHLPAAVPEPAANDEGHRKSN